jgi:hypothetical protein
MPIRHCRKGVSRKEGVRCAGEGRYFKPEATASVTARTREGVGAEFRRLVGQRRHQPDREPQGDQLRDLAQNHAVNLDGAFLSVMACKDEMLQKPENYGRIFISSVAAPAPAQDADSLCVELKPPFQRWCCAAAPRRSRSHVRVNCLRRTY